MRPSILPVASADAQIIATLAETIWRHHYVNIISAAQIDYMLQQRYQSGLIRQQLLNPGIWWRKLTLDDAIIGFSCCMHTHNPGELKIDKLYIHYDHHRKGYGALLVADAIQILRENNLQSLILTVNKNNRSAISAYRHYGFAITGDSIVNIGNGFVMNDYLMTLEKLNRTAD
ncbi:MAG: GNAT family N-acetyltransferase [Gammaproteobacteria bacterium]|nr:MAG: GNAT family N-acetyltransferase [Gammaproteobacteria bacterium]